ncbi:hypothetical protein EHS25_004545 [Saitozyma podzolica]|uniref:Uncharacterized protein n=1 Tax=Saitozyma podzolica TaxID=1890683 RepID=A0A427YUD0_9TREE|nr:hypothetical protein EHS25_004545 [Saitozyma podzolica]
MSTTDRQPLLPQHVNHTPHKLSTSRISFPPSSTSALGADGPDAGESSGSVNAGSKRAWGTAGRGGERQGLPKLSGECLWAEIKCYGSYILPVLLVFGVLVIGLSLVAVGWKKGWFGSR